MSEEFRQYPGDSRYLVGTKGTIIGAKGSPLKTELHRTGTGKEPYRRVWVGGKHRYVHAMVLETYVGPKPPDMNLGRHLNGNSLDNSIENLRWGTYSENELDKVAHGTHQNARKTHCKRQHELSPENVYVTSWGGRQCRACVRHNRRLRRSRRSVGTETCVSKTPA